MSIHNIQFFNSSIMHFNSSFINFTKVLFLAFLLASPLACVDLEFDQPPAGGFDPNIPVNTTIAQLKAMHTLGAYEEITEELTFSAIVISNDEAGNFFKQLVVQDETGGIEIRIEMTNMHNIFPVGRKVYVKAKGLWLGDYNGLIQLGAGYDPVEESLIRLPESLVDDFIIPATYGNPVIPKTVTINQLTFADVSTLIKLEDVQFVAADAGRLWADGVLSGTNRFLEDCSMRRIIIRTSKFARFATENTPECNGDVVAVLGIFGSDYQLTIRDVDDVMMTDERCGSITVNSVDESFNAIDNDDDIILPGWSNIAVKGTRLWRAKIFQGNHYAQATSFGDSAPEMESWLITPKINLSVPKKLSFESTTSFYVHDGLSVWVSTNFNCFNVNSTTWTQIFPVLATTQNSFIPSGSIDLSGFTGSIHIGFKYVGSGPGGQTTTFRVDNVKVENL